MPLSGTGLAVVVDAVVETVAVEVAILQESPGPEGGLSRSGTMSLDIEDRAVTANCYST